MDRAQEIEVDNKSLTEDIGIVVDDSVAGGSEGNVGKVNWFRRVLKTKGFKASVIVGVIIGFFLGCAEAITLFGCEMARVQIASAFPFGGLLADGFNQRFWRMLAAVAIGCVFMGMVGSCVAVAVAVRGGNVLRYPITYGAVGSVAGGIVVFFVAILGWAGWDFRAAFVTLRMILPLSPIMLADLIKQLIWR